MAPKEVGRAGGPRVTKGSQRRGCARLGAPGSMSSSTSPGLNCACSDHAISKRGERGQRRSEKAVERQRRAMKVREGQ